MRLVNRPGTGHQHNELREDATIAVPPWRLSRSRAMPSEAVA
jgi:hypothetical protein